MPNASVIGDRAEVVLPAIDVLDHAVRRWADLPHALDGRFHLVRRPELKLLVVVVGIVVRERPVPADALLEVSKQVAIERHELRRVADDLAVVAGVLVHGADAADEAAAWDDDDLGMSDEEEEAARLKQEKREATRRAREEKKAQLRAAQEAKRAAKAAGIGSAGGAKKLAAGDDD